MKHQGKVVVVTGAGQGMGRAIVECFAKEGAQIAALDINQSAAEETAQAVGENAIGMACDIADSAAVKKAMAAVIERFGRLDVVVNNAGTGSVDEFLETPDENWARVIGVNLTGTFLCSREGARLMQQGGEGG
ncbi:SDR family NAD(P)-dependent oxidoreductase [Halomonas sp. PR-M31]|uniref:SDR family NAD(P)-dependent oxidoreductase n=1 Tax=Halomonas sp. PR-M31 TaxID=1471202 RepID=UPI000B28345D|nr:SDR family NAD(P)-dependent oxidoreductase [Halomonas sp. PR-M31]